MYSKTIWYAEDGEMFENEQDCFDHEGNQELEYILCRKNLEILDAKRDSIVEKDFISEATYLYIGDDDAAEAFYNFLESYCETCMYEIYRPHQKEDKKNRDEFFLYPGHWYFNEEDESWHNFEIEKAQLEKIEKVWEKD